MKSLLENLKTSKTEEDVKSCFTKFFKIKYDTADKHNLYTNQILFEFKLDKNFSNSKILANILAQILYYVRRIKFGETKTDKPIPRFLCLADMTQAVLTETTL
ncbi:MAG: hypothetical protein Fur0024_1400 [Patescibacteria group bacterium]